MIDTPETMTEFFTRPITTTLAAAMTTTVGALNRFSTDLPMVHEFLGDLSMIVGIVACIALARVHILRGNLLSKRNRELTEEEGQDDS